MVPEGEFIKKFMSETRLRGVFKTLALGLERENQRCNRQIRNHPTIINNNGNLQTKLFLKFFMFSVFGILTFLALYWFSELRCYRFSRIFKFSFIFCLISFSFFGFFAFFLLHSKCNCFSGILDFHLSCTHCLFVPCFCSFHFSRRS